MSRYPFYTRYTAHHHLRAEILNGVFNGIFGLKEIVAKKALGASDLEMTILITMFSSSFLLGSIWGPMMEGRSKKPFFVWGGLIGRGSLIAVAGITSAAWFIGIIALTLIAQTAFQPAQQSILQANYPQSHRARIFSRIVLFMQLTSVLLAVTGGALLNWNGEIYRWLFPAAGIIGGASYIWYGTIRIRRAGTRIREFQHSPDRKARQPIRSGIRHFFEVLKTNPDFRRYEINFFLYGIAFMLPLVVNENVLIDIEYFGLDYDLYAVIKLATFAITMALFMPVGGWLQDRLGVSCASGWFFLTLALYPIGMFASLSLLTHHPELAFALLVLSFFVWGVAMSGVMMAWNLGSSSFAGDRDASALMSVHVSMVGLRGLLFPGLGMLIGQTFGYRAVYVCSAVLFLVASAGMFLLHYTMNVKPTASSAD
jgi:MFS family permease